MATLTLELRDITLETLQLKLEQAQLDNPNATMEGEVLGPWIRDIVYNWANVPDGAPEDEQREVLDIKRRSIARERTKREEAAKAQAEAKRVPATESPVAIEE